MKKIVVGILGVAAMSNVIAAPIVHCPTTYHDARFTGVTVFSVGLRNYGRVICNYQHHVLDILPKNKNYMPAGGDWTCAMPGFQFCTVAHDPKNSAKTCTFRFLF